MTWFWVENPRVHQNPWDLIKEFSKAAGYKNQHAQSVAFLYTNNELSEREIARMIPFIIASKTVRYLGTNITKEMKDLYTENY